MNRMVAVKFFCTVCGKEIWQNMENEAKYKLTVREAEKTAVCWDCLMKIPLTKKNIPVVKERLTQMGVL